MSSPAWERGARRESESGDEADAIGRGVDEEAQGEDLPAVDSEPGSATPTLDTDGEPQSKPFAVLATGLAFSSTRKEVADFFSEAGVRVEDVVLPDEHECVVGLPGRTASTRARPTGCALRTH